MPVKKLHASMEECTEKCCSSSSVARTGGRALLFTLVGILIVYGIVFLGTLIRNNLKKYETIGQADRAEHTIVVDAEGKVTATPNIAMITMGMTANGKTVADAQQKNTEVMNNLLVKLSGLAVDNKDIQTVNYNIYPQYDYTAGKQVLNGYQVSQNVVVKIRDLSKANQVLALAGEVGANNVSGLQFTVDDRDVYKEQAREIALQKVADKAQALSKALGVHMVGVVSYNEYEGNASGKGGYMPTAMATDGMGGGPTPTVDAGSNDIIMDVNVVFEIR